MTMTGRHKIHRADRHERVAVRLLAGSKEPGGLDLGTLRQHKSILHVDAKISHGVLDLGMAE